MIRGLVWHYVKGPHPWGSRFIVNLTAPHEIADLGFPASPCGSCAPGVELTINRHPQSHCGYCQLERVSADCSLLQPITALCIDIIVSSML